MKMQYIVKLHHQLTEKSINIHICRYLLHTEFLVTQSSCASWSSKARMLSSSFHVRH